MSDFFKKVMTKDQYESMHKGDVESTPEVETTQQFSGYIGKGSGRVMYRQWIPQFTEPMGIEAGITPTYAGYYDSGAMIHWADASSARDDIKAINDKKYFQRSVYAARQSIVVTILAQDSFTEVSESVQAKGYSLLEVTPCSLADAYNRADYHLYWLPSLVQAIAVASGTIDKPVFDYTTLHIEGCPLEEQYRIIGGGAVVEEVNGYPKLVDKTIVDGEVMDIHDSELWHMRQKLWEAIGEDDADVCTIQDAKSDVLRLALLFTYGNGQGEDYEAFPLIVKYRRIRKLYGGGINARGKDQNVAIFEAVYADDEEATAAAGDNAAGPIEPVIPTNWNGGDKQRQMWRDEVQRMYSEYGVLNGKTPKALAKELEDFDATVEHYTAWAEYLSGGE